MSIDIRELHTGFSTLPLILGGGFSEFMRRIEPTSSRILYQATPLLELTEKSKDLERCIQLLKKNPSLSEQERMN